MDLKEFFNSIRPYMPGGKLTQGQVDGFIAILTLCDTLGLTHSKTAYILATAYHETAYTMQPVREGLARSDAEAIRIITRMYNKGRIRRNYATPDPVTGESYYGRGYVQLTWKENYQKAGLLTGLDLVKNPNLALQDSAAAQILVVGMLQGMFRKNSLGDFIDETKASFEDFVNARDVINGDVSKIGPVVANHAVTFQKALEDASYELA